MANNYYELGTTLYKYSYTNGRLIIKTGVVVERTGYISNWVKFDKTYEKEPRPGIIGNLQTGTRCPYIWMTERNDKEAISKVLDYLIEKTESINNEMQRLNKDRDDLINIIENLKNKEL